MDGLFQTALSNAVLVAAAAPIVWAITKLSGKPALTHALWLVLLLKLIIPPIWLIPFHLPPVRTGEIKRVHESEVRLDAPPDMRPAVSSEIESQQMPRSIDVLDSHADLPVTHALSASQSAAIPAAHSLEISRIGQTAFEWLWTAGSLLCLGVAIIRMRRFTRSLRYATLAPAPIQRRIEQLAQRLNLSRVPPVWFVPGTLSPMLWAVGGPPRVLIPQALWERLTSAQRDAILIHELAHWRRRDHWVRWIELLTTTLYWWHPACWWACRELREAEEQCCDAWVVCATGDFRHYANALLEAVDFISARAERPFARSAVPALASGLGQFGHLKRRIIMLKNRNISRALTRYGIAATFSLASLLLPLSPTFAQESPGALAPAPVPEAPVAPSATVDQPSAASAGDAARELRDAKRQIAELAKKLDEAEARIKVLQQGTSSRGQTNWDRAPNAGSNQFAAPESIPAATPRARGAAGGQPKPGAQGIYSTSNVPQLHSNFVPAGSTDRLDKIEAELHSLLREIEDLRASNGTVRPPAGYEGAKK